MTLTSEAKGEWNRKWRAAHREQLREYNQKYHAAHREHRREYSRAYSREYHANGGRKRPAEYADDSRERSRKYRVANDESIREYRRRRAGAVRVAGERWQLNNQMPPELKEVLLTLRQARQAIRQAKRGETTK